MPANAAKHKARAKKGEKVNHKPASRSGQRQAGHSRAGEFQKHRDALIKPYKDAKEAAEVALEEARQTLERQLQKMKDEQDLKAPKDADVQVQLCCCVAEQNCRELADAAEPHMSQMPSDMFSASPAWLQLAKLHQLYEHQGKELQSAMQRACKAEGELRALQEAPAPRPQIVLVPARPSRW